MKVESITPFVQKFDDGTVSNTGLRIVFERDGQEQAKTVMVSGLATKCSTDPKLRREWGWVLMKAAREADRDLAFRAHGKDNWRDHCEYKQDFWSLLTQEQFQSLMDSVPNDA